MKTLKEIKNKFWIEHQESKAYYEWYKDAIEWIFNDIVNSQATSVETIEKYLQDLLTK
jgi:hemerythrin-like domain-containing protein